MNKLKILMTGGSGLLGKTLVPLLKDSADITHFDMRDPKDGNPFINGDLRDLDALQNACNGMDAVLHIAALHGKAWREAGDALGFEVNVVGTKNVLEAAVNNNVKRVLFTSSIWATGHGANPPYLPIDEELPREPAEMYGLTKVLGEKMCRYYSTNYGISTIVLRPGGIRPADTFDPQGKIYLSAGVDVRDVAAAHKCALLVSEDIVHDVFVITADSPLGKVSAEAYKEDPTGAFMEAITGIGLLIDNGTIDPSSIGEWYTVEKAKRVLGYCPQYNFRA